MDFLSGIAFYVIPFLIVLSVVVFVHEFGHYLVARANGVRIETFSIGFGSELFGFDDRHGTRWKFSVLPLGGYVKMLGDADATSSTTDAATARATDSFPAKRVGQRMAIVAAGPLANFFFAIVVLAGLFAFVGQPFTPAEVGFVQEGGPAATAGVREGDRILAIDGAPIDSFETLQQIVWTRPGEPLEVLIGRDGRELTLTITPEMSERTDRFGNNLEGGLIGIGRAGVEFRQANPASALFQAASETWGIISGTIQALGQMIAGDRGTEELGGPLRIAQMSGQIAQDGFVPALWFTAILSINLGLINLFPIPMLDGGHLVLYAIEAVRGRPLNERSQEMAFRVGLALVLSIMVFATWNDFVQLGVFEFFAGLVS